MRKGILAVSCIAAVALGIGAALGFGGPLIDRLRAEEEGAPRERPAQSVQIATAAETEIFDTFSAVANTRAIRSVEIFALGGGIVTALDIPTGTRVEAGYPLLQLDDRAERAALRQVEARLGEAEATAARTRELSERNVAADASVETAEAALALVEAELEAARLAVEDRRVAAPFAGTLGLTDIQVGQRIETTDVITTIDDLSQIEVIFNLPEYLFPQVAVGQPLRAVAAGGAQVFEGEVAQVGTRIDPAARFFELRGRFDNPDGTLTTGMLVNVDLTLETRVAVAVPEIAIVNIGPDTVVFVLENGEAREVAVETGLLQEGLVEVRDGLTPGAQVIVSGLQSVEDGDPVEVENGAATLAQDSPP